MENLNINLRSDVFAMLEGFCEETGSSKEQIAADVIREFLEDYIADAHDEVEDLEEAQRVAAEIDAGRMEVIAAEDVYRKLGI